MTVEFGWMFLLYCAIKYLIGKVTVMHKSYAIFAGSSNVCLLSKFYYRNWPNKKNNCQNMSVQLPSINTVNSCLKVRSTGIIMSLYICIIFDGFRSMAVKFSEFSRANKNPPIFLILLFKNNLNRVNLVH